MLAKMADELDVVYSMIQDRGLTEVAPGSSDRARDRARAIDKIDKITGDLPLMK